MTWKNDRFQEKRGLAMEELQKFERATGHRRKLRTMRSAQQHRRGHPIRGEREETATAGAVLEHPEADTVA